MVIPMDYSHCNWASMSSFVTTEVMIFSTRVSAKAFKGRGLSSNHAPRHNFPPQKEKKKRKSQED